MNKNKITIRVLGFTNSGKSTIGKEIQDALSKAGFFTSFTHDYPEMDMGSNIQEKRIKALLDKKLEIEIIETSLYKDGSEPR